LSMIMGQLSKEQQARSGSDVNNNLDLSSS